LAAEKEQSPRHKLILMIEHVLTAKDCRWQWSAAAMSWPLSARHSVAVL